MTGHETVIEDVEFATAEGLGELGGNGAAGQLPVRGSFPCVLSI